MRKRAVVDSKFCVACGCCARACRYGAAKVLYGTQVTIDHSRCAGCGMCASSCPVGIITLEVVPEN